MDEAEYERALRYLTKDIETAEEDYIREERTQNELLQSRLDGVVPITGKDTSAYLTVRSYWNRVHNDVIQQAWEKRAKAFSRAEARFKATVDKLTAPPSDDPELLD